MGMSVDFMEVTREILKGEHRSKDFILNMDQTPIPFTFNANRTLEMIGKRTVHIRKSTNDTKRVTGAMTVTASGKLLPIYLVFKGKPGGRIEQREFPTYPQGAFYACQVNAWMDENIMHKWVQDVLKPYVQTAPSHIVPILFLDSYRCHMMESVVSKIQELRCEVQHIPGGCTSLCQPVDVGVNKPFKNKLKTQWEDWMMAEGILTGQTRPPTRELITKWSLKACEEMEEQTIRNAWLHDKYTFFHSTCATAPIAAAPIAAAAPIDNVDEN
jgi:DDE superfamily endonuclease